jgi:uncharacterized membrane protein YqaE (UPF0057 family)
MPHTFPLSDLVSFLLPPSLVFITQLLSKGIFNDLVYPINILLSFFSIFIGGCKMMLPTTFF